MKHKQIIIEKNDQLLKINHIVFLHLNLIISKKYSNKILLIILLFFSRNITLILKNTNEFFSKDADIHFDSSTFLPINSSILYEGYVLGK
jgi:hypothetical protein